MAEEQVDRQDGMSPADRRIRQLQRRAAARAEAQEVVEEESQEARSYWRQIQAESREMPIYPRFMGLTSSAAVFHPADVKARYVAHQAALEKVSFWTSNLPILILLVVAPIGLFIGLAMKWSTEGAARASAEWTWVHVGVLMAFVCGLGYLIGWVIRLRRWYSATYGYAVVQEMTDRAEPWRVTRLGFLNLPQLAFVGEDEDYYFGSTAAAGVDSAMMLLRATAQHGNIIDMTPTDLFKLPPGTGKFTGVSSSSADSMVKSTCKMADYELQENKKGRRFEPSEVGLFLMLVLMAVLVFLQAASGYQASPQDLNIPGTGGDESASLLQRC